MIIINVEWSRTSALRVFVAAESLCELDARCPAWSSGVFVIVILVVSVYLPLIVCVSVTWIGNWSMGHWCAGAIIFSFISSFAYTHPHTQPSNVSEHHAHIHKREHAWKSRREAAEMAIDELHRTQIFCVVVARLLRSRNGSTEEVSRALVAIVRMECRLRCRQWRWCACVWAFLGTGKCQSLRTRLCLAFAECHDCFVLILNVFFLLIWIFRTFFSFIRSPTGTLSVYFG